MGGYSSYLPVGLTDEEDDEQKKQLYPAVAPVSPAAVSAPSASSPYPAAVGTSDLENRMSVPRESVQDASRPTAQAPQWSDYAPVQPHGAKGFLEGLGAFISPGFGNYLENRREKPAEEAYKAATAEYERPAAEAAQAAGTSEKESQAREANARADALEHPPAKVGTTPEEQTFASLLTQANPETGKPYTPMEAFQKINQSKQDVKPDKTEDAEQQFVDEYRKKNPNASIADAQRAFKQNETVSEPGNYMPFFDPQTGKLTGAWDPKSGHVVQPPQIAGTTGQGVGIYDKAQQAIGAYQALNDSFNGYRADIAKANLSPQDVHALQVLTDPQKIAHSFVEKEAAGVLDSLFGEPLTGYSEKAMNGIMTKDQYEKLSPDGKKLLVDYFDSVISNFADMKQRLGGIGRNEAMIQAEIHTIPLPYIPKDAADAALEKKLHSIRTRNPNGAPEAQPANGNQNANAGAGAKAAPKAGDVVDGWKFKGGDPSKKENWSK